MCTRKTSLFFCTYVLMSFSPQPIQKRDRRQTHHSSQQHDPHWPYLQVSPKFALIPNCFFWSFSPSMWVITETQQWLNGFPGFCARAPPSPPQASWPPWWGRCCRASLPPSPEAMVSPYPKVASKLGRTIAQHVVLALALAVCKARWVDFDTGLGVWWKPLGETWKTLRSRHPDAIGSSSSLTLRILP